MARRAKTQSFKAFELNSTRAQAFVRIFDHDRQRGKPSSEDVQLLRGALVFAVGALDAYLHDLVLEIVPAFVPESDELHKVLALINTGKLTQAMARASDQATARNHFANAIENHFDESSFMGPAGVDRAARLVGCRVLWSRVVSAKTATQLKADLGRYTDIRHKIVHRAQNPRPTRQITVDCNDVICAIASHIDRAVIGEHYA